MSSCKGFGRIDCVVTVLCVAFLIPAIGAVHLQGSIRAKAVLCRSNLQKWYVAASMFTGDNDDSFWPGWMGTAADSVWWLEAMQPYYEDFGKICCCPTATQPEWLENSSLHGPGWDKQPFMAWGHDPWLDPHGVFDREPWGSYAANGWLEDKPISSMFNPPYWRSMAAVKTPGNVPYMTDAQWLDAWPEPSDRPPPEETTYWQDNPGGHFVRIVQNRHGDGWQNCAFLDGSARKVGLKELWTFKWHKDYDTAGRWTLAGGVTSSDWPEWMRGFQDY